MSLKWWKRWLGRNKTNRAQRRASVNRNYRPEIHRLEERDVPAAYVPTDLDHIWMAKQTEYLLGQANSNVPFTYAHQWVVGLTSAANPAALAQQFGVANDETTPLIDRTHLWDFAVNENYQATAANLAAAQQSGLVAFYYPSLSYAYAQFYVPNDPLYNTQWHLNNTGQAGGTAGEDIKAQAGWDIAKGNGQMVVVTDTGTQIDHPDLIGSRWTNPDEIAGNGVDDDGNGFIDDLYGWNFENDTNNPSSGDHGTSVTGIISAKGDNAVGVTGVAFNSQWSAFKAIGTAGATDANLARALNYKSRYAAAYNNSWGFNAIDDLASQGPMMKAAIINSINNGRNGLGSVMVFAAGNSGDLGERTNYHEPENMPYVLNVSALTNNGTLASYSTFGSSVFVAAPSATITTDETGSNGYDSGDYTTGFGGTSAAAPVVAGVVADILSVNPNLRARDVFHILARTSTKIQPNDPSWQTNGAGRHTSHKFGLGRPNLGAALALARTWVSVNPVIETETVSVAPNQAIPDNDTNGATSSVTITKNFEAEYAVVRTRITHARRGDLELVLVSPSGTTSLLAEVHGDDNPDYNWQFASTQFWGEKVGGQWRLIVRDKVTGNTGTVDNWELELTGVKTAPPVIGGPGGGNLEIMPSPSPEGGTVTLGGKFVDPDGAGEVHYVDVNWGDGTGVQRVKLFIGQTSFVVPHVYRDNSSYVVTASIVDEGGNVSSPDSGTVVINNVAPIASILGAPLTAPEGKPISLFGQATDPGVLDTHTFNWTVTKNGVAYANGQGQAYTFTPDDQGIYRVNLVAVDDDGGASVSVQSRITVTNVAPTGNFTNDGPKAAAPQNITFTFTPVDSALDIASMKYSYDFNGDGDFTDAASGIFPADILNGASPTATVSFTGNGFFTVNGRMLDKDGASSLFSTQVVIGAPVLYNPTTKFYVAGSGVGMPSRARAFGAAHTMVYDFQPYGPGFMGGTRVATGDVNGDNIEDVITAAGPGGGPHIKVFSGADGTVLKDFLVPQLPGYVGGLQVAAGDLNSDGKADIILGTNTGRVVVIDGASGANATLGGFDFIVFPGFAGVVNVGAGDYNGDRIQDLVVGTGAGVAPQVRIYRSDLAGGAGNPVLLTAFAPFEASMTGGVTVAIGDVNGDGRGDIIVGGGAKTGYQSRVKVFNGKNTAQTLWNIAPFPGFTGGIQVSAKDLDGDGKADILMTPNSGFSSRLLALKGTNLKKLAYQIPFDVAFLGGVFVG